MLLFVGVVGLVGETFPDPDEFVVLFELLDDTPVNGTATVEGVYVGANSIYLAVIWGSLTLQVKLIYNYNCPKHPHKH